MTEKKPQVPRQRRPDGYDPYRDRPTPPHLEKADLKDGRDHPEADQQHYGEAPAEAPKNGGSGKPRTPAVKTQR